MHDYELRELPLAQPLGSRLSLQLQGFEYTVREGAESLLLLQQLFLPLDEASLSSLREFIDRYIHWHSYGVALPPCHLASLLERPAQNKCCCSNKKKRAAVREAHPQQGQQALSEFQSHLWERISQKDPVVEQLSGDTPAFNAECFALFLLHQTPSLGLLDRLCGEGRFLARVARLFMDEFRGGLALFQLELPRVLQEERFVSTRGFFEQAAVLVA